MKREVELAKRLLESKGYTVSRVKESSYTYSGHNVSDDLQQYLVTVVIGGSDGDRETGMIAPEYYTELVSAIDEEDAKHQVEKVLDPGDGITDVHLATPEEIAEWEHSAYEYMDESKKMKESYSPNTLEELVREYAPKLQYGGETLASIWDDIFQEYGDEDLANDVIEALENEDVYESKKVNEAVKPNGGDGKNFEMFYVGPGYPKFEDILAYARKNGFKKFYWASDTAYGYKGIYNGDTVVIYKDENNLPSGYKEDAKKKGEPINESVNEAMNVSFMYAGHGFDEITKGNKTVIEIDSLRVDCRAESTDGKNWKIYNRGKLEGTEKCSSKDDVAESIIQYAGLDESVSESTDDRQQRRIVKAIAEEVIKEHGENNLIGTYDAFIRKMIDNWATSGQDRDFIKAAIEKSFDKELVVKESKNINESSSSEYYYLKDIIDTWNIVEKYDLPYTESDKGIRVYKKDYDDLMKSVKNPRYLMNLIRHSIKESADIPQTEQYKGYYIMSYDNFGATVYMKDKRIGEFENIDDARDYIDEISNRNNLKESIRRKLLRESSSKENNEFQIGDIISYSMLYGGNVRAKVVDRTSDKLVVRENWVAEDTWEDASTDEEYTILTNDEGVEYIVTWEYHGEKGVVYPPHSKYSSN